MSTSSDFKPSNMSRSPSQANCMDPLDALVDFSEYEQMSSYQSPSISPSASSKPQYVRPVASTPTANNALLPSSQQALSGPSHNYDMYKQQTGIPSGAIANTLAMNTTNMFNYNYMSGIGAGEDFLDFNQTPASFDGIGATMELDFDSPSASPAFFYPEQSLASSSEYVNPSVIGGQENQVMPPAAVLPTQSSNVGRLWPGMHQQQAALAKAQQQQKQQQQLIQQQRQQSMSQQSKQQRPKSHQASDPLVEEKISQLLNSMRHSSVSTSDDNDAHGSAGMAHVHRMRKEEEDMDEDERLLASEEGKKLSSKERRQLRNKVSARAFRSRRKEYIGQLEGEIAAKVNENSDLRVQNRALMEENTRLSDLTRMLLSSPSFSGFLDTLTPNVAGQQQQPQAPVEQQLPAQTQVRKDINPYAAQAQMNNQRISMAIIPEHTVDFSMLDLNGDGGYSYQPQVFSVLEVPEPLVDISVLSGKGSNFVGSSFTSDEEKVQIPVIERPTIKEVAAPVEEVEVVDEEFDADPMFALFAQSSSTPSSSVPVELELSFLFGGIQSEKAFARFELVDAVDDSAANLAMARVERLCAKLDPVMARLEALTSDL